MSNTDQDVSPAVQIQQLLAGFETSQALYVVAELGVATALLGGPRSVDDLAAVTGANSDALGRIIRFLTPLGVFRGVAGGVEVTDLGRTLADGPADSVRGLARYWMETHYAPFGALLHTARTGETGATTFLGKPFFEWVNESKCLAELQNSAMASAGRAARGDLLGGYQLPAGETVADIGGADGTVLAALLANDPGRRGIVFDLPNVVAGATEKLTALGLSDRITVVGGDFLHSVPVANVYLMSAVLHDWDNPSATRILANVARAARPGARLLLVEMVMPEGDGPHFTKMVDLTMLAMVGGRERTEMEWRQLLGENGFSIDRIIPGSGTMSIIEATLT